jgi:hypothetical protein
MQVAHIPEFSRTQLSKVLCRPFQFNFSRNVLSYKEEALCTTDFGTISLNNSIFNLPAGVSPMLISMNTIGRVEEDICEGGTWEELKPEIVTNVV